MSRYYDISKYPGTRVRDLARSLNSDKMFRLLRRVAGVRHILTLESRLIVNQVSACVRTEP